MSSESVDDEESKNLGAEEGERYRKRRKLSDKDKKSFQGERFLLHRWAKEASIERMVCLLESENPPDIDEKDDTSKTPLHWATLMGHVDVARLLLDRGSRSLDATDDNRLTPLHLAARNGHVDVARLLLDRGSRSLDATTEHRRTPLHYAARNGHVDVARLLLDRGSRSLDAIDRLGNTPLHRVATTATRPNSDDRGAPSAVVNLLLERGSRAQGTTNRSGDTPFDLAERAGNSEVMSTLVRWRGRTMLRCVRGDATSRYRRHFWRGVFEFSAGAKRAE